MTDQPQAHRVPGITDTHLHSARVFTAYQHATWVMEQNPVG